MPKTHMFTIEQHQEVMLLQKKVEKNGVLSKKLQVLQLRMEGYKNDEIARITQYSKSRVSALVCIYANMGISYFQEEHRKGGNHRNMTFEEEAALLAGFRKSAESGNIITVADIKRKYEETVGHSIGKGHIYIILKRHGWRKVMPRSKHPKKADKEAIEASKKLTIA